MQGFTHTAARMGGIAFGVATHALFAVTVWQLVQFLAGHGPDVGAKFAHATTSRSIVIDASLATMFAVPHSVLLLPAVRRALTARLIPQAFYGLFYCVVTCVVLLVTIVAWQPSNVVVWEWPAPLSQWVTAAFIGCWGLLLYSLHLTGLGYQTGLTPWWHWVRGLPQERREFRPRGAYGILRHPVYLSFLGLVWLTPVVTLDRAVLILIWTAYIYVGSVLKDRRLAFFIGEPYRTYQARVPGYPGMPAGPLARVPAGTMGR
jgi:protein-S-isoprenylcysteine O-methyltransferase Ste14